MELPVGSITGIGGLYLKLFLIPKMLGHIGHKEIQGGLHLASSFSLGTGVQQVVHCLEKLPVLTVNQGVACFQVLCHLISHVLFLLRIFQSLEFSHVLAVLLKQFVQNGYKMADFRFGQLFVRAQFPALPAHLLVNQG